MKVYSIISVVLMIFVFLFLSTSCDEVNKISNPDDTNTNTSDLNSKLITSNLQRIFLTTNMYSDSEGQADTLVYDRIDFDNFIGQVISSGFTENGKRFSFRSLNDSSGNNIFDDTRIDFTFNDDRTEIIFIKAYKHRIDPTYSTDLTQDMELEFTVNSHIPITTSDINSINANGIIEYKSEMGPEANFSSWSVENFPEAECGWTYKDTKGRKRLLIVQIKFAL